jgi:hypothetical protein
LLTLASFGCGRTALEPTTAQAAADAGMDHPRDLAAEKMDAPRDMAPDLQPEHPLDLSPDKAPPPTCVPTGDEKCNGLDDDCNGLVDDAIAPIPCPGGGKRLCISGAFSECPRSCHVCVPGSKRTCITSFCTFWGSQQCAKDGMSFGDCRESTPPPECAGVASRMMRSRELEECCINSGYCCVDEFDLNENNNTTEMLGRCESITCD